VSYWYLPLVYVVVLRGMSCFCLDAVVIINKVTVEDQRVAAAVASFRHY